MDRRTGIKAFFTNRWIIFSVWMVLPVAAWIAERFTVNNFDIFRYVFFHTIDQVSLYDAYPDFYLDVNHYGPFFSLLISPFAVLPQWLGFLLWNIALTLFLYFAIKSKPSTLNSQLSTSFVLWFCANELFTALALAQFNIAIAATLILAFYCVEKGKDQWATFFIMLGGFVKIYSLIGLVFFLFSRHKSRFLLTSLFWAVVMFVAPMLISSPEYIIGQYQEWYESIVTKNNDNLFAFYQNISVLGMFRKISGNALYSDIWIMLPAMIVFCIPLLRFRQYQNKSFRELILASALMFIVLFSTGSESCSYIIALVGVAIWYVAVPWKRSKCDIALMVFVFVVTSLSPTDIFPVSLKKGLIQPYALKALPVFIVWLKLSYELLFQFRQRVF